MQPTRAAIFVVIAGTISASGVHAQCQWETTFAGAGATGGEVSALASYYGSLYVGGQFTQIGGVTANNIAKWDGRTWRALGTGIGQPFAIAGFDDGSGPKIYAAGAWGSGTTTNVRRWNWTAWETPGAGLSGGPQVGNQPWVFALTVFDDGVGPKLYAGGNFGQVAPPVLMRIARWSGTAWQDVGTGINGGEPTFNPVYAFATYGPAEGPRGLFVGGDFDLAGGIVATNIARWDGQWSAVGGGMNGAVNTLAEFDDGGGPDLYAAGEFSQAGGSSADRIARWNGVSWSAVGLGLDDEVMTLTAYTEGNVASLFVGGKFANAGGTAASRLARWNGTAWSAVSGSVTGTWVRALQVFDDGTGPALYVGGAFDNAGGLAAHNIARWKCTPVASCYADCNNDGVLTVADFGCFQTKFVVGCP